jgi:hypothetical protein
MLEQQCFGESLRERKENDQKKRRSEIKKFSEFRCLSPARNRKVSIAQ